MRILRLIKRLAIASFMLTLLMLTIRHWAHSPDGDPIRPKETHHLLSPHKQPKITERPKNVSLPATPMPAITTLVQTFRSLQEELQYIYKKYMPNPWKPYLDKSNHPGPNNVSLSSTDTFTSQQNELLYMYQKYLLTSWKPNFNKLKRLRNEIFTISNTTSINQIGLTESDAHSDVPIIFYIKSKKVGPKITDSLLKYLPKDPVLPNGTVYRKCSVVGNSGILLGSSCGKEIDSSDFVFRCNFTPIKKFSVDAGFKSNFTTMNPTIIRIRYDRLHTKKNETDFNRDLDEYNGQLYLPCLFENTILRLCTSYILPATRRKLLSSKNNSKLRVFIGNPWHLKGILKLWKAKGIRYMSTGFYLAQTAVTMCDEVHLYGFWPFNRSVTPSFRNYSYHFFDAMKQKNAHKFNQEFQILWQLHKQGVLRLHAHDCN